MYLYSKFQAKQTKDAKVMSKKTPIESQGDKKKDKCFLQSAQSISLTITTQCFYSTI